MHFIVGEDERVHDFHIEMWDRAMAANLIPQIEEFRGKLWQDFMRWMLENRIFLKIMMIFGFFPTETVYFWSVPDENMVEDMVASFTRPAPKPIVIAEILLIQAGSTLELRILDENLSRVATLCHMKQVRFKLEVMDAASIATTFYRNRKGILNNIPLGPTMGPVMLQKPICKSCGAPLPSTAKFCNRCGQKT